MKELKVRVLGFAEVEKRLREQKAAKCGESKERATYFDTEGRGGLCIVEGGAGESRVEIGEERDLVGAKKGARMSLAAYNEEDGCFDIATAPVGSAAETRRIFTRLFRNSGQATLDKRIYRMGEVEVWLVHIDGLGNFVLLRNGMGNAEKLHDVLGLLGIEPDRIVKKNFGEMMFKTEERI